MEAELGAGDGAREGGDARGGCGARGSCVAQEGGGARGVAASLGRAAALMGRLRSSACLFFIEPNDGSVPLVCPK